MLAAKLAGSAARTPRTTGSRAPPSRGCPKRRPRELHSRRHAREPRIDRLEIVLDDGEVGAGLIDLAESEGVFVWHAAQRRPSTLAPRGPEKGTRNENAAVR
jgi:hypothetical protein